MWIQKSLIARRPSLIKTRAFSPQRCWHWLKLTDTSLWLQWKGIDSNEPSSRVCTAPSGSSVGHQSRADTRRISRIRRRKSEEPSSKRESERCRILIPQHHQKEEFPWRTRYENVSEWCLDLLSRQHLKSPSDIRHQKIWKIFHLQNKVCKFCCFQSKTASSDLIEDKSRKRFKLFPATVSSKERKVQQIPASALADEPRWKQISYRCGRHQWVNMWFLLFTEEEGKQQPSTWFPPFVLTTIAHGSTFLLPQAWISCWVNEAAWRPREEEGDRQVVGRAGVKRWSSKRR